MKIKKKLFRLSLFFLSVYIVLKMASFLVPSPELFLAKNKVRAVVDREGRLLRELKKAGRPNGGYVDLADVSRDVIDATLFVEDRYFFYHPGFNPVSMGRAFFQNIVAGRIVAGGSTLTQQLARQLANRKSRSYLQKTQELIYAILLELRYSKKQLLSYYLSIAPYSNEIYGIESASQIYFKKNTSDLNFTEALYLASLVRAPTLYNPYRHPDRVLNRYSALLRAYVKRNPDKPRELFASEPVVHRREGVYLAPHFVDFVLDQESLNWSDDKLITSLDLELQTSVERMLKDQVSVLKDKGVTQAAALVLDPKTGEIVAWVGSADYWDAETDGQYNGVLAHRQPGSALKPFTYALAFERGMLPNRILADIKTDFQTDRGLYQPQNYDHVFHGPVRARLALGSSLNVPAVRLLDELGVVPLYSLLTGLGFKGLTREASYYGLGLTLGNAEASLLEMTPAYALFLNNGNLIAPTFYADKKSNLDQKSVFSDRSAFFVRDILADDTARSLAFGMDGPLNFDFPVLVKTGTSSNHRDNWAFGVTPHYAVGVWAGNFDNDPMKGVSGVSGAAPLMNKIISYLHRNKQTQWPAIPADLVKYELCSLSGRLKGPLCPHEIVEWLPEGSEIGWCDYHTSYAVDLRNGLLASQTCPETVRREKLRIKYPDLYTSWAREEGVFQALPPQSPLCEDDHNAVLGGPLVIHNPKNGDIYQIDPTIPLISQKIHISISGGNPPYQILMDGKVLKEIDGMAQWNLLKGSHTLIVRDRTSFKESYFEVK